MRKKIFGRKLKRTTNQRKALFKSLSQALFLHGRIKTTEAKAKAVRGEIEKLITIAKKHEDNAMQFLQKQVASTTAEEVIRIAPVFKDRQGGYTRIVRLGARTKDNAAMVILELTEKMPAVEKISKEKSPAKKEEKKTVAKKEVKSKKETKK